MHQSLPHQSFPEKHLSKPSENDAEMTIVTIKPPLVVFSMSLTQATLSFFTHTCRSLYFRSAYSPLCTSEKPEANGSSLMLRVPFESVCDDGRSLRETQILWSFRWVRSKAEPAGDKLSRVYSWFSGSDPNQWKAGTLSRYSIMVTTSFISRVWTNSSNSLLPRIFDSWLGNWGDDPSNRSSVSIQSFVTVNRPPDVGRALGSTRGLGGVA